MEHIPYVHTAGCTGVLVGGKTIVLFCVSFNSKQLNSASAKHGTQSSIATYLRLQRKPNTAAALPKLPFLTLRALLPAFKPLFVFQFSFFILGAGNNPSHEAKSVSPDLRTALISLTCGAGWASEAGNAAVAHAMTEWSKRLYRYGTGVYYNEPDYCLQNWKVKFLETMRYDKKSRISSS